MVDLSKSQKGMGLIEVLIAMGLLAAISLGVAQLGKNMNRIGKTSETNAEINAFILDASYILSDRENCRQTIPNGTPFNTALTQIVRDASGAPQVVYEVGNVYGNGTFSLESMTVKAVPSGGAELEINIKREHSFSYGGKVITKRIPLEVVITGSTIDQCFSNVDTIIASAVKQACGFGYSDNNASIYDPSTQSCIHRVEHNTCSPGQVIAAIITSDGKTISTCTDVIHSPASCSDGQYLQSIDAGGTATCVDLATANPAGCDPTKQYAVRLESGLIHCQNFPACSAKGILRVNSSGAIICEDIPCDSSNQYFAGYQAGNPICKTFPSGVCGPGQFIKEVKIDGSSICAPVPPEVGIPKQDFFFVDGYDLTTQTWSRKNITQTAEQICNHIGGYSWRTATATCERDTEANPAVIAYSCSSSGYINNFDSPVNYSTYGSNAIAGVTSYHQNQQEDRRFTFRSCQVRVDDQAATRKASLLFPQVNDYDQRVVFNCPADMILTGVSSTHNNGAEDRVFGYTCSSFHYNGKRLKYKNCISTGWVNNFDQAVNYTPPSNYFLVGEDSYHDNGKEDRRFLYRSCSLELE